MQHVTTKIKEVCFIWWLDNHKCQGARKSILCDGIYFLSQKFRGSHSLVSAREVYVGLKWLKREAV